MERLDTHNKALFRTRRRYCSGQKPFCALCKKNLAKARIYWASKLGDTKSTTESSYRLLLYTADKTRGRPVLLSVLSGYSQALASSNNAHTKLDLFKMVDALCQGMAPFYGRESIDASRP